MAEKLFDRIRNGLKQAQAEAEERRDFKIKLACYEESYRESKSRKPQLPDLESMADLKKQDPHAYADKLDELAHMRSSIDAAYEAAKKIPDFDKNHPSATFYGESYLAVGKAVHDAWCMENSQKFSDPNRADRLWQHLSAEAIGHDEFVKDLKYVDIVMKQKGFPSYMEDKFVAQSEGNTGYAQECVRDAYAVALRSYEAKTPEEKRNFELDRWSALTVRKAAKAEADLATRSDAYYLAMSLPKADEVPSDPNASKLLDDFYAYEDTKYFVGEPYRITTWDGMYTYAHNCNAVDMAIEQADGKFKSDRVKMAESSLGIESSGQGTTPHDEREQMASDLAGLW